jgi:hypothetical protein
LACARDLPRERCWPPCLRWPFAPLALLLSTPSPPALHPLQEKAALKADKEAKEAKYKYALVDGRQEMVRLEVENQGSVLAEGAEGSLLGMAVAVTHGPPLPPAFIPPPPLFHSFFPLIYPAFPVTFTSPPPPPPPRGPARWATSEWSRRGSSAAAESTPRWARSRSASTLGTSPSTSARGCPCRNTHIRVGGEGMGVGDAVSVADGGWMGAIARRSRGLLLCGVFLCSKCMKERVGRLPPTAELIRPGRARPASRACSKRSCRPTALLFADRHAAVLQASGGRRCGTTRR